MSAQCSAHCVSKTSLQRRLEEAEAAATECKSQISELALALQESEAKCIQLETAASRSVGKMHY